MWGLWSEHNMLGFLSQPVSWWLTGINKWAVHRNEAWVSCWLRQLTSFAQLLVMSHYRQFHFSIDFFSKPEPKWTKTSYHTAPRRYPPLPSMATSRSFALCCPARSQPTPGSMRPAPGPAGPRWWWLPRWAASRRFSVFSNEGRIPTAKTSEEFSTPRKWQHLKGTIKPVLTRKKVLPSFTVEK